MDFVVGQRWISQTEPRLGLGMLIEIDTRHIALSFPAAEETRTYAKQSAPLVRVHYQQGDVVNTREVEHVTLTEVHEHNGIIHYRGFDARHEMVQFTEMDLDSSVLLSSPKERLLSSQFDKKKCFELRVATLNHLNRQHISPVKGLIGARTSHLPHQVYIASEVAQRYAPRVLLADEVGLGKTIEAGMILHYQLHTGRASRVLIIVPESLVHQWLVEMLRRFNLAFSIFDHGRYEALLEEGQENPFETGQLVLCSLDFLVHNASAFECAKAAGWDLMVVDEAHHLHWSELEPSAEYRCVEQLAEQSEGLLLLTATPEQAGISSHFARLRLLDPDRFFDLSRFEQEEKGYQQLNQMVRSLQQDPGSLGAEEQRLLTGYLGGDVDITRVLAGEQSVDTLIDRLLDRHGTGRVLFRNTRQAIQGFPERKVIPHPLPQPELYSVGGLDRGVEALTPEAGVSEQLWLQHDPRVEWVKDLLAGLKQEKILVICARVDTAISLEQHLRLYKGVRSAAFHEDLSLLERDRAAAYFADMEFGAQVLICSEIGSEGRNFQFAHHLVLFDLPLNPDLLEQRIGRLDRIGQTETIHIHVPYLESGAQEALYRWYHFGPGLFERSVAAAFAIYKHFEEPLLAALSADDPVALEALVTEAAAYTSGVLKAQQEGRDQLLELHSCNKEKAAEIIDRIDEQEDSPELMAYMESMFDVYGVDSDEHSEHARIIMPGDHMRGGHFPGLRDEPITVTFSREQALSRDDMHFLSWEHPIVVESMDMVSSSELGNACVVTISIKALPPGTLLLESVFTASTVAPKYLQVDSFLPVTPIRFLVDVTGKDLSAVVPHDKLNAMSENIRRQTGQAVLKQVRDEFFLMLEKSTAMAEKQLPDILLKARENLEHSLDVEIERLVALKKVNPSIRQDEIDFYLARKELGLAAIDGATIQVQALRLVVNS
ncbi:MAG: RNA polymerase-associated protein RapA [Gammaproteobacteria bacterium]|nr:MAG: RNA polymerase-associated protein RapA [Pseudomonadota bacterium]PIE38192.1 MAG: RNA polymerase-associated protein RapA [Gammaproteobacteria bacterium]